MNKWIDVKKKLPNKNGWYICWYKIGCRTLFFYEKKWWKYNNNSGYMGYNERNLIKTVRAWQPLLNKPEFL